MGATVAWVATGSSVAEVYHQVSTNHPCHQIDAVMTKSYSLPATNPPVNHSGWPWPRCIAHRGAGVLAPENTLAAFRTGHAHGYRMAEYDVKLSADDIPILLHDDTVNRTTNGQGVAATSSLAQLSALDAGSWHGRQWAGEPIPTLSSIAAFSIAHHMHSNIEIKPSSGLEAHTGAVVARHAQTLWATASLPPLLSSFSEQALASARMAAPELPRALLIEGHLPADWARRARALDCLGINLDDKLASREVVTDILRAGHTLVVWTVNDADRARQLLDWGCHAIVTDTLKPFT